MEYGTNAFTCSQVAMAKFAVPGRCWQGSFLDPDHNVFGIFQVDKRAK